MDLLKKERSCSKHKMEKKIFGKNWYLGETFHAGIGQGYWQTSPLQLMFDDSTNC